MTLFLPTYPPKNRVVCHAMPYRQPSRPPSVGPVQLCVRHGTREKAETAAAESRTLRCSLPRCVSAFPFPLLGSRSSSSAHVTAALYPSGLSTDTASAAPPQLSKGREAELHRRYTGIETLDVDGFSAQYVGVLATGDARRVGCRMVQRRYRADSRAAAAVERQVSQQQV